MRLRNLSASDNADANGIGVSGHGQITVALGSGVPWSSSGSCALGTGDGVERVRDGLVRVHGFASGTQFAGAAARPGCRVERELTP